ncbi:MAG TPA: polysaccharide deacetylase family protein [Solirubrobacterales bacterium]|nr:polysaccharide deacetylase family protein [Solirubrobacterales bacterium]
MNPQLLVLCYHAISDTWPEQTAVASWDLSGQIEALLARGYRGATFTDALTAPPSPRTLVVTFDDAAASVYHRAAPVLDALGVPGTVFVPTDFPDRSEPMAWAGLEHWVGGPHEAELACMSWEQLGTLLENGWEVGSHTCSHPRLPSLADEELDRELRDSRCECEKRLGADCLSLAYPYGAVDDRVARAARRAGYAVAAIAPVAPTPPLPLLWPRVGVYRGDSPRRVWLRARHRALGSTPLVGASLATAKRAVDAFRR